MHTLEQLRSGQLAGVRRLSLVCGDEFPAEIFTLADTLEILDLSGSSLSSLPADLPRLHRLRVLFCSNNRFTALPEVLGDCAQLSMVGFKANRIRQVPAAALPPRLRWLILTDNALEALPPEIGRCADLQKLMLAGNRLTALPPELAQCTRLELLRIAANRLDALPEWLLAMPRLSWLAYAGNPFCESVASVPAAAAIAWTDLRIQQQLGEGASGVICRAEQQSERRPVAVKLFKGDVTSDGLPACEMAACLTAGAHPNLIPVLGRVDGHPAGSPGLVMALIDPAFVNLAGPPSLDSCTRDVYAPGTRFERQAALRIARGIASAARHLHAQGLMHGDLYGHNILHDGQGRALLGDFGAASFHVGDGGALERLEVRAFGCLLEELVAHGEAPESLHALAQACLDDRPASRPLFADIEAALATEH